MSHALCIMAGFLAASFTFSTALEISGERTFGTFVGMVACLIAAAVMRAVFNQ